MDSKNKNSSPFEEENVVKIGDRLTGKAKEEFLAECRQYFAEFLDELQQLPPDELDKFINED